MGGIIICGEIAKEDITGSPIEVFKQAIRLCKKPNWLIATNNPQLIETMEVIYGEEDIEIFLTMDGVFIEIDFCTAYDYTADIYDILNGFRFRQDVLDGRITDVDIESEINEYEAKYKRLFKGDYK